MQLKKGTPILVVSVLLSNVAIVAGAVAFGWSPLTIVVLFVLDAALGAVRMSFERLFAGKPTAGDVRTPEYPMSPMPPFLYMTPIYEGLLDKRGAISIAGRMPRFYPRNIPYALECWLFVVPLSFCLTILWFAIGPPVGRIDGSIWSVLVLFGARHVLIVSTWTAAGVYEQGSPVTARRIREFLFSFAIAGVAIVVVAPQSAQSAGATVAATAAIPLVAKLPFDFREAGIGPSPLTFDPRSDTTEESIPIPLGKPRRVHQPNSAGVDSNAALWGTLHMVTTPGLAIICLFGLVALVYESLLIGLAGVFIFLLVALALDYVALWLAYGNVEFRVYEDALVAYDRFLEETQWSVPVEDMRTVSTDEDALEPRILPFVTFPVVIERATEEDLRLEYIDRPEEVVRSVRQLLASQSNVV